VTAGEADRPAALANEQHRPGDAGGDDPVNAALELRLAPGRALGRGGRRRHRHGDEHREGGQQGQRDLAGRTSHGGSDSFVVQRRTIRHQAPASG
jgi:hypothetical protein